MAGYKWWSTFALALSCLFVDSNILTGEAIGASVRFTSIEAEDGTIGGGATIVALTSSPNTQYSSPELEASGHAYVQLSATGQYVEFTMTGQQGITFVNVRASIPDAPTGGGLTATLDLLVNGEFRQAVNLSSKQSWGYEGGDNHYSSPSQNPADGNPWIFFDEAHAFISGAPVTAGQTIRLQKSGANTATFYYIDVIDLEAPPPPSSQGAQALSIASFGAVPNDATVDNSAAIQSCVNAAEMQGKSV